MLSICINQSSALNITFILMSTLIMIAWTFHKLEMRKQKRALRYCKQSRHRNFVDNVRVKWIAEMLQQIEDAGGNLDCIDLDEDSEAEEAAGPADSSKNKQSGSKSASKKGEKSASKKGENSRSSSASKNKKSTKAAKKSTYVQ